MAYEYILYVVLATGGPRVAIPVHDCGAMKSWQHDAFAWRRRSMIPIEHGPIAACVPAGMIPGAQLTSYDGS